MAPEPQPEPLLAVAVEPPAHQKLSEASKGVGTGSRQESFAVRVNYYFAATLLLLLLAMILASVSLNKTTLGWLVEKTSSDRDPSIGFSVSYGTLLYERLTLQSYDSLDCRAEYELEPDDDAKEQAEKLEQERWCEDLKSAAAVGRGFMQFAVVVTAMALLATAFIVIWPLAYGAEPVVKPDLLRPVGVACVAAPAVLISFAFLLFITIFPHEKRSRQEQELQEACSQSIEHDQDRIIDDSPCGLSINVIPGEGMALVFFANLFACCGCCAGAFGYLKKFM